MSKARGSLLVLVSAGILLSVYLMSAHRTAPPVPAEPVTQAPPAPADQPPTRYVLDAEPQSEPLPALGVSDDAMKAALQTLWANGRLELFRFDNLIRRVVATVDNLPRRELSERLRPFAPAPGQFRTAAQDGDLTISPENRERYRRYVELAKVADAAKVVAVYAHFYPLFQQAYADLGYPNGHFNDRLIEVIDHLVAAPELPEHARLAQPKVFYHFADADLQQRSAGEKILMRMGNENAAAIKAKLREIRAELVRRSRAQ